MDLVSIVIFDTYVDYVTKRKWDIDIENISPLGVRGGT